MSKTGAPRKKQKYVPPVKIYQIEVDDGGIYDGTWLRIKSVPAGRYISLLQLAEGIDIEELKAGKATAEESSATFRQMIELFGEFSKKLIEWNVEEQLDPDDESDDPETRPVPATSEGVMSQEFDFIMFLIGEWMGAMGGVSGPLETKPNDSETLSSEAFEAELASLSLPSSPVPSS